MIEYLSMKDVPESMKGIAEVIGIEAYRKLILFAGGGYIYVPTLASSIRPIRNRLIKENYRGDVKELSRKFGISEVLVRNIISS